MRVLGVDFTSRPQRDRPLAVAEAWLEGDLLTVAGLSELTAYAEYETLLRAPGPWVAAVDHPFGLPKLFVEEVGWPLAWDALVARVGAIGEARFRETVADFKAGRPAGRKDVPRRTDVHADARSALKLVKPPVALMFLQGAPRLLEAGVAAPPCHPQGDPERVVLEGYPALVARTLIGRTPYKGAGWRAGRRRLALLDGLPGGLAAAYGVRVDLPEPLRLNALLDGGGDLLDAVLCAVQAASACRAPGYGIPTRADPLEGWIADPLTR